jgi:hypothetical protein
MPSGQDFASRLLDETRRTLAGHLLSFEEEFRILQANLAASNSAIDQIAQRLGSARSIDTSAVEATLADALAASAEEGIRKRDEEMLFLAHFAHDIRQKETQEEILGLLLDGAHRYAPRLALFVTRGEQFLGWSSRGFTDEVAQNLNQHPLAFSESALLQGALEADGLTTAEDVSREATLVQLLPQIDQGPWHAFPLKAIKRPVAVLLASAAEGRNCDLESLCILMDLTGLCVENMALKILHEMKIAKPAAAKPVPDKPAAVSVAEPASPEPESESEETVVESIPAAETAAPAAEQAHDEESPESTTVAAAPVTPVEAAPEAAAAVQTQEVPEPAEAEASAEVSQAVIEPMPGEPEASPVEAIPVEEPAPPVAQVAAGQAPAAAVEKPEPVKTTVLREVQPLTEEERLHGDAKRFARLLASEIKLYNEQRVQEGRTNGDLYVRLKRDIDRSRDMYEKRISPLVSRKVDYFHDEIIRVLGDNDPSTLGSDYPGPRVES